MRHGTMGAQPRWQKPVIKQLFYQGKNLTDADFSTNVQGLKGQGWMIHLDLRFSRQTFPMLLQLLLAGLHTPRGGRD